MKTLNIFCDLKEGIRDTEFSDALTSLLTSLQAEGRISSFRITRRMLGLGPPEIPEWNILIDFENLSQLDDAFGEMAGRADPTETLHHAVNSKVRKLMISLYRDFPDPERVRGQEKF